MANTFILIAKTVLQTGTSSITFSGIPNTYTDLLLRFSSRANTGTGNNSSIVYGRINNDSTNIYSLIQTYSDGTTGNTFTNEYYQPNGSAQFMYRSVGASQTANTFNNGEMYIPNYGTSITKQHYIFAVNEYDASSVEGAVWHAARFYNSTNAVSSLVLTDGNNDGFAANSSFYLYGISKS